MKKQLFIIFLFLGFLISFSYNTSGETPLTIEINIPEYTVEEMGGYDYVDIPGGDILLVDGKPRVPYYFVYIDYAKGYRIQNVIMIERSGLQTTIGLNLPIITIEPDPSSKRDPSSSEQEGWFPEEDYSWETWINSDSSSTLVITMYPFYYNPETNESKFYRNYRFDIEYIVSNMTITTLCTNKDIYEPGGEISVDMWINNSGEAQDIVVGIVIKEYGTDEIVADLPLRTLKNFTSIGTHSVNWKSNETEPGYYYAEATLTDTSGNWLDRKTEGFAIQIPEVTMEEKGFPYFELILIISVIALISITTIAVLLKKRGKPKR
jgi:hypothetical protein